MKVPIPTIEATKSQIDCIIAAAAGVLVKEDFEVSALAMTYLLCVGVRCGHRDVEEGEKMLDRCWTMNRSQTNRIRVQFGAACASH